MGNYFLDTQYIQEVLTQVLMSADTVMLAEKSSSSEDGGGNEAW